MLTGTSCIMHVLLRLVEAVVWHLEVSHRKNARLPIVGDPEALQMWKWFKNWYAAALLQGELLTNQLTRRRTCSHHGIFVWILRIIAFPCVWIVHLISGRLSLRVIGHQRFLEHCVFVLGPFLRRWEELAFVRESDLCRKELLARRHCFAELILLHLLVLALLNILLSTST